MEKKPTLKEYLHFNHDGVIMSQDGSFFLVKPKSKLFLVLLGLIILIIGVLLPILNILFDGWRNIAIDMVLLCFLMMELLMRLHYNSCIFERINDDNEDYKETIDRLRSKSNRKYTMQKLLIALFVVFVIANSFTSFYIRSLVENKISIDLHISFSNQGYGDEFVFQNCENISELTLPNYMEQNMIYIDADISGKADSFQFKRNGQTIANMDSTKSKGFIWDEKIFRQNYDGYCSLVDQSDNSILEISSGSFSRQWTIKTE